MKAGGWRDIVSTIVDRLIGARDPRGIQTPRPFPGRLLLGLFALWRFVDIHVGGWDEMEWEKDSSAPWFMQVLLNDPDKRQRMLDIVEEARKVTEHPIGVHVPEDVERAIQQLHMWLTRKLEEA
jgi:hypothetical protein